MNEKLKIVLRKFPFLHRLIYHNIRKINQEKGVKEEIDFLLDYIGKDKIIIEIGVFMGYTTMQLAKDNFVIGIDPFGEELLTAYREYPKDVYGKFIENNLDKNVTLFPMTSKKAFELWDKYIKLEVDVILIDGDHSLEGVTMDFRWDKYLKRGGIIAFHDSNSNGVDLFIKGDLFQNRNYKYLGERGILKIFRK